MEVTPWIQESLRVRVCLSYPRVPQIIQQVDPRIHFALVCGAKSCPPIKLYTPENLDEGLDAAGA